jgi:cytochrome P450
MNDPPRLGASGAAGMQLDPVARTLSLDPRDPVFVQDPYTTYAAMHASAPVIRWAQMGQWCFAGHAEVAGLLRDRRFGRQILHVATREQLGWPEPPAMLAPVRAFERHSLLELEPPAHTRLRGLVNRAFTAPHIQHLRPRIEAIAHRCIDAFEADGAADLIERFATPIPVAVIAGMLGVPFEMAPQLLAWSHDMVAIYQARRDETIERRAADATVAFTGYVRSLLTARRGATGDDLLGQLLTAEHGDRLSEDELVSTVILLLNAGHEATVHAIGNGVKALLEHRVDPGRLCADAAAVATIEELLRFDPPLHLFSRYALEDIEIHGVTLERGDQVGLLLGAANRDPLRFPDPDRLDPERSPNPHVSFGAGIHFCLGAPLARLELLVSLRVLFERLPNLGLDATPRYRDTYHFRGLETLPVTW